MSSPRTVTGPEPGAGAAFVGAALLGSIAENTSMIIIMQFFSQQLNFCQQILSTMLI